MKDPRGYSTTATYDDSFGAPNGNATTNTSPSELSGVSQTSYAFATSVTNALSQTTYSQFDFYTGMPVDGQDINGVVSSGYSTSEPLDRPTKIVRAVGTSLVNQTSFAYDDTNRIITTTSDLTTYNDSSPLKTESLYDGLGRTYETRNYETSSTYIKVTQTYDALGRSKRTYNPFRTTSDPTYGWAENTYDALGRVTTVTSADSTTVSTSYSGNAVTVTDQANKSRRSISDGIGRLIRVDEPDQYGSLGSVGSPNQATSYSYDVLGNLIRVQQGSQNRYFMYDSLGRMLRVSQPEQETNTALNTSGNPDNNSWTAGFTYDDNGNVLTTTDAKNTTITSTYDALNRALTRTYSDSTPTVTNYYDGAGLPSVPNYSNGKLTRVSSSVSDTRYTGFDALGRLTENKQITGTRTYTSSYQYNLAGAMKQETYPSGRVMNVDYSSVSGDIYSIYGTPYGGSQKTYADNFTYAADKKIQQLKLGNGLWETATINSRLQVTDFKLGTTQGAENVWKLTNEYGELQSGGSVDASKNNGNIAKQTVNFTGLANPFVQSYKYDSLDRLSEGKETVNGTQTWIQNWGYDRYGNRSSFSQNVLGNTAVSNPTIDAATNRFTTGQGYTFDKNGNITNDPFSSGRTFVFNGDNKQTEVKDSSNVTIGTYYYDGEGKRIKKVVTGGESTVFVYSNGRLVEERNVSNNRLKTSYLYAGSQLLATEDDTDTNFTVTDHLGSPRVVVNGSGTVVSRRDFLPFGEELFADGTYRKTSDNYSTTGTDAVRQRFTGYQKDTETGLDFAEARMYQNQHGRFTAIDPLLASGKSANPQTFNRYVYTMNRPLMLTDSSGLQSGFPAFSFSTYVRAFAPYNWFGPGNVALGDGRGFSADPKASYRIQAFSEVTAGNPGIVPMSFTRASDPTTSVTLFSVPIGQMVGWDALSEAYINDANGNYAPDGIMGGHESLDYQVYGNDDAIPFVSSDIDLNVNLKFGYEDKGGGTVNMSVTGSVKGDQFPAAEAFVRDKKGNSVMLGTFAPSAGSGPVLSLPFNKSAPMIDVNVNIQVKNGVFTGVLEKGKLVSLEDYNKRFTNQPAVMPK